MKIKHKRWNGSGTLSLIKYSLQHVYVSTKKN